MPHKNIEDKRAYDALPHNREKARIRASEWNKNHPGIVAQRVIKWQRDNKEEYSIKSKNWVKANPNKRKNIMLKHEYGITLEDYYQMLFSQNNSCNICGSNMPGGKKNFFSVDHCHKSKKVRGLLCDLCNKGLGHFRDDINLLKAAIEYLQQ